MWLPGASTSSLTTFSHRMYLLISFSESTPPHNRHLIVYYYFLKYQVFCEGVDFSKLINKYIEPDKTSWLAGVPTSSLRWPLQGYLNYKKTPPPRTLQ